MVVVAHGVHSIHLRLEEKISLSVSRDGGLQNLEVLGMIWLRITDEKFGRVKIGICNNDSKGIQLQVRCSCRRVGLTSFYSDAPERGQEAVSRGVGFGAEEPDEAFSDERRCGSAKVALPDAGRLLCSSLK